MDQTNIFARPFEFTIRVYGLLLDADKRLLVSDEFIRGNYFTKLPGGGLEIGEGTRDCLVREFKEETNLEVTTGDHFYTTDFFQQSAFNSRHQIISIYYFVHTPNTAQLSTKEKRFDFSPQQIADSSGQCEVLRWIEWTALNEDCMDLPIDKVVIKQLKQYTALK